MSFLDHIRVCNAYDPDHYRPLYVGESVIGQVKKDLARKLKEYPGVFWMADHGLSLVPGLATPSDRTAAVAEVMDRLASAGLAPDPLGEMFPVVSAFAAPELMRLDRAMVPLLGVRAFGVHLNGVVHTDEGLKMWVGRRSPTKRVAPGKLDNLVAGGQPAGLSLRDNLIKECAEEADMPADLAARARPVGAVTYCMEGQHGLKPDCMFCFDLELSPDFVPRNTDGEIDTFLLWPMERVLETVRNTTEFKFNVNLVILDFAIRHGLLSPDDEPDYLEILLALRRFGP
ncbi:MAG: DUF4743 domain-containing protein [Alphaproteobacteria bacterium]